MEGENVQSGAPSWLLSRKFSLACLLLATSLGICATMEDNPLQPLDNLIYDFFFLHGSSDFARFSRLVLSTPGHFETAVLGGIIGTIILYRSSQRPSIFAFILPLMLTGVVSSSLKELVSRIRPHTSVGMGDYAWPSGHSMLATVLWGLICFIIIRNYATKSTGNSMIIRMAETRNATRIWFAIVIFTGSARMLAGVHWFTDVIGGIAIGILILQAALKMEEHLGIDG
ncbi:MAG: hypothetical protein CMA61_02260 [Euryarchaeota archaeon]|nr:hypothetical protein [Euryarchaeota archaeon]